jgi:hypothetical protein
MNRVAALALSAALLSVSAARAADTLIPGKITIVKAGTLAKFVSKPAGLFPLPAPQGTGDPTSAGAGGGGGQLQKFDTALAGAGADTYGLPAAGWKGLGNPAGSKGYKYKGTGSPTDPCKVVLIKEKVIKAVCKGSGIMLTPPFAADEGIVLSVGSGNERYCALFGGTEVKNTSDLFKHKDALAPGACPVIPIATTTSSSSSSTSTSTSSTTSTTAPVCGNGVVEPGEQCEGPGSSCGAAGLCDANCQCPCNGSGCPCDFLDPSACLFPYPSDFFTVLDPMTDTGLRVNFETVAMPKNGMGVSMDVTEYNRKDGFSPGSAIITRVPNVDLTQTGAPPITDIAQSLAAGSPTVIVNANTLAHHLHFAEIDSNASSEGVRALIMRPSVNFEPGERYIVALRDMRDPMGAIIAPNADFLAYRDNILTGDPVKEARRPHMEALFTTLAAAGVPRANLYLAWDFTVASVRNTTDRLLFMRDDAFARLGVNAPSFTITNVNEGTGSGWSTNIFRRVAGTMTVDRYVDNVNAPARLVLDSNGLPVYQATDQTANFVCLIPKAALANAGATAVPARASIYGHGLLGNATEVEAGNVQAMANEHNFVFCATRWMGMASDDVTTAISILGELGQFPYFPDRQHQGMLNQLMLARLMIHPNGLTANAAFKDSFGNPVIDTSNVFFDGNSQGGIFGGTVMAIAQDITRGVLGVPGMNYSNLLTRSSDFPTYATFLYPSYTNQLTRQLLLSLIQQLWDRTDPNGLARHITNDNLPGTPQHFVMLHEAFGDHQVSNLATQIEARTIGASVHTPTLNPGRSYEVTPYYGIPPIASYPFAGSALIPYDSGAATPPSTNTAPNVSFDPHSDPRSSVIARQQKSDFLQAGGSVTDVCGGLACVIPH